MEITFISNIGYFTPPRATIHFPLFLFSANLTYNDATWSCVPFIMIFLMHTYKHQKTTYKKSYAEYSIWSPCSWQGTQFRKAINFFAANFTKGTGKMNKAIWTPSRILYLGQSKYKHVKTFRSQRKMLHMYYAPLLRGFVSPCENLKAAIFPWFSYIMQTRHVHPRIQSDFINSAITDVRARCEQDSYILLWLSQGQGRTGSTGKVFLTKATVYTCVIIARIPE